MRHFSCYNKSMPYTLENDGRVEPKIGRKEKWTEDVIRLAFARYINDKGRSPTAMEIDSCGYLPSSRQIQRKYPGGLPALRAHIGIKGPIDFTRGETAAKNVLMSQDRGQAIKDEVYQLLDARLGKKAIVREYFFTEKDKRSKADFHVSDSKMTFYVDVFYATNLRNISTCLTARLRKYENMPGRSASHTIILVQANPDHDQDVIDELLANKKEPLGKNYKLMSMDTFAKYISKKKPRN